MIKGLHHNAYRCRDSEETRAFYEEFLELPLANAFRLGETKTGRAVNALHSFFRLGDGSFLAFFEVPDMAFDFKEQHDFDLHIALEVDEDTLHRMFAKGKSAGIDTRGIADHGFIHSIYFRDPNGYVIELTAPVGGDADHAEKAEARSHAILDEWQAKPRVDSRAGGAVRAPRVRLPLANSGLFAYGPAVRANAEPRGAPRRTSSPP